MREKKGPSSFLYILLGAITIIASIIISLILLASGVLIVTPKHSGVFIVVGIIYGISIFSILALLYKWHEAPERAKIFQSHQMLTIANETSGYLRTGFSQETAKEVAKIILNGTDADAVAITDNVHLMAFAGFGEEYHQPGSSIPKRDTNIVEPDLQVFQAKEDSGCPDTSDFSWSGVAASLTIQERIIGTLELLYLAPKKIAKSHLTVASGLGKLLSTQLELSELGKQREMAFKSELKALQAQINPHFLFNTLNTIAALCRTDPQTARHLIIKFADFFRDSLERQKEFITLEEELEYVNSYLVFEQARFGPKLSIKKEIESAARRVKLPSLVLQPLVENAIKHGMAKRGQLNLHLSAKLDHKNLVIFVKDDGIGIDAEKISRINRARDNRGLGIGLTNIRDRLKSLYGKSNLLNISSTIGQGTQVTLQIPLKGGRNEN